MSQALLCTEPHHWNGPINVISTYPIPGWLQDWTQKSQGVMAQTPTLAKWGVYL